MATVPKTTIELLDKSQYTKVDVSSPEGPIFFQIVPATAPGKIGLKLCESLGAFYEFAGEPNTNTIPTIDNGLLSYKIAEKLIGGGGRVYAAAVDTSASWLPEKFFTEAAYTKFTEELFDNDQVKIDVILDAGYNNDCKDQLASLVNFREDCLFIRDVRATPETNIITAVAALSKSKYIANYPLYYETIIDDNIVKVTGGYGLASLLPAHIIAGRSRPLCGSRYGAYIDGVLDGTMVPLPISTPTKDQRQDYVDNNINYGSITPSGRFIIETQRTSQTANTGLSYVSNVLLVQQLMKEIRTRCPKIRYSFADGEDFEKYQADVQRVIDRFVDQFKSIEFEYIQDETMVQNKVYYASIKVSFRNYIEAEHFKIIAI